MPHSLQVATYIFIIFIVKPCESCGILLQFGMLGDMFTFTILLYIYYSEKILKSEKKQHFM